MGWHVPHRRGSTRDAQDSTPDGRVRVSFRLSGNLEFVWKLLMAGNSFALRVWVGDSIKLKIAEAHTGVTAPGPVGPRSALNSHVLVFPFLLPPPCFVVMTIIIITIINLVLLGEDTLS